MEAKKKKLKKKGTPLPSPLNHKAFSSADLRMDGATWENWQMENPLQMWGLENKAEGQFESCKF